MAGSWWEGRRRGRKSGRDACRRRETGAKHRPPAFRWTWLARFERLESRRLLSGQPDLTITTVTAPATAIEGNAATITVDWTVENHGTAAAAAPWTDAVYLSSAATLDAGSVQIASLDESRQAPLAPGASYTISHQITLPEFAAGQDFLIVRTNDGGSLDEATSTDDLYSLPLTLNPPDVSLVATSLTATGPNGDASVAAGDGLFALSPACQVARWSGFMT